MLPRGARKRAQLLLPLLDNFFKDPQIPLNFTSTYTLLIATLLSAQTTDERVNLVTEVLFQRASTPEAMVKIPKNTLLEILHSVGLAPTKAENILQLSRILLERYNGEVPSKLEDLISLPGVGRKTAAVVLVQGFGIPDFPVDTHVARLALRWGLSKEKNPDTISQDLKKLFPKKLWGKVHLQMVLFGRNFCRAQRHSEETCPACSFIRLLA